jgi:deoxyadenosine/deoxycytidine kinase
MAGHVVAVEGNIGSGKSTLAAALAGPHARSRVITDSAVDSPFFPLFYADPKRYAKDFQLDLLDSRAASYRRAVALAAQGYTVFVDQSVWSDEVFARQSHEDGNISDAGLAEYWQRHAELTKDLPPPDVVLFLSVSPDVCYYRVHTLRARREEASLPLGYLRALDAQYAAWLGRLPCPVAKLDWEVFGSRGQVSALLTKVFETRPEDHEWAGDVLVEA